MALSDDILIIDCARTMCIDNWHFVVGSTKILAKIYISKIFRSTHEFYEELWNVERHQNGPYETYTYHAPYIKYNVLNFAPALMRVCESIDDRWVSTASVEYVNVSGEEGIFVKVTVIFFPFGPWLTLWRK